MVPTPTPSTNATSSPTTGTAVFHDYAFPSNSTGVGGLTVGPDKQSLWFTEIGANKFGKITMNGQITEYPGAPDVAYDITSGPDGNLWFTTNGGKIGEVSPSGAILAEYALGNTSASVITSDVTDGRLWVGFSGYPPLHQPSSIAAFDTSGKESGPYELPNQQYGVEVITTDAHGNIWFTEGGVAQRIGFATTVGTIVAEYTISNNASAVLYGLTPGPDGNMWYTDEGRQVVGKITTSGTITEYPVPQLPGQTIVPGPITTGADGNLWVGLHEQFGDDGIARVTPSGQITEFGHPNSAPGFIASGPDGNIWFAEILSGTSDGIGVLELSSTH